MNDVRAFLPAMVGVVVPCRGGDAVIHLVRRDASTLGPQQGKHALCSARGEFSSRHVQYRWRRVERPGRRHCQVCWAKAHAERLEIRWQKG